MKARELMSYPPLTCHVNDPMTAAAHLMWEHDCGAIAVINDEGRLTSMITDRDICMAAYTQARPLADMLVNSAMAKHVVSAGPDTSAVDLEQLMAKHQVRRIPIVDADGRPIGIVSLADLAIDSVRPGSNGALARLARTLAKIDQPRPDGQERTA